MSTLGPRAASQSVSCAAWLPWAGVPAAHQTMACIGDAASWPCLAVPGAVAAGMERSSHASAAGASPLSPCPSTDVEERAVPVQARRGCAGSSVVRANTRSRRGSAAQQRARVRWPSTGTRRGHSMSSQGSRNKSAAHAPHNARFASNSRVASLRVGCCRRHSRRTRCPSVRGSQNASAEYSGLRSIRAHKTVPMPPKLCVVRADGTDPACWA